MSLVASLNEWGEAALGSMPFGGVLVKAKQSGAELLSAGWQKLKGTHGLKEDVAEAAQALINAWNEDYAEETGALAVVYEGIRTKKRQEKLVGEGRSHTMQSKHLTGDAVDIWFKVSGAWIAPDDVPVEWYEALGEIGEEIGFTWGGRWKTLVDMPHFEA